MIFTLSIIFHTFIITFILFKSVYTKPTIKLTHLKGFPDLWGEGANRISGGRGGIKFFITTLSPSDIATLIPASNGNDAYYTGSLTGALKLSEPRHIIPRISGRIVRTSMLYFEDVSDFSYHGHLGPVGGLLVTGDRIFHQDNTNFIFRFFKAREGNQAEMGVDDAMTSVRPKKMAVDHSSFAWAGDETFSIAVAIGMYDDIIVQNNIIAQSRDGHNTGSILGYTDPGYGYNLKVSWHKNYYSGVTHRTPNYSGDTISEARLYNNVIYHWRARLTNVVGGPKVDLGYCYFKMGPDSVNSARLNKVQTASGRPYPPSIWSGWNYVDVHKTVPENNDHANTWNDFFDNTEPPVGIISEMKRTTPLPIDSDVGYHPISAFDAYKAIVTEKEVGCNRQVDSTGKIVFGHDSIDNFYLDAARQKTTAYLAESSWIHPSIPSNTPYPDTNFNGIYDGFETKHNIKSADEVIVTWDFDDYIVINDAGYDAFEMWSAYVAGDFDRLSATEPLCDGLTNEQGACGNDEGRGVCTAIDVCSCSDDYIGVNCEYPKCDPICNDHQHCSDVDVCSCRNGWSGQGCFDPICSDCPTNSECTAPEICSCIDGWTGNNCDQQEGTCNPQCNEREECSSSNICVCKNGYIGVDCEPRCQPDCIKNQNCSSPNTCSCLIGWIGINCDHRDCRDHYAGLYCSDCEYGWTGDNCQTYLYSGGWSWVIPVSISSIIVIILVIIVVILIVCVYVKVKKKPEALSNVLLETQINPLSKSEVDDEFVISTDM